MTTKEREIRQKIARLTKELEEIEMVLDEDPLFDLQFSNHQFKILQDEYPTIEERTRSLKFMKSLAELSSMEYLAKQKIKNRKKTIKKYSALASGIKVVLFDLELELYHLNKK